MIELTIKRENGEIEKTEWENGGMNEILFSKIQKATKAAGKGDVLSWKYIDDRSAGEKTIENRKKEAGYCDKCQSYCYGDCRAN